MINYVDYFITDECCGDSVGENGRRQGWKSVLSRILIGIEIQKFLNVNDLDNCVKCMKLFLYTIYLQLYLHNKISSVWHYKVINGQSNI